MLYMCSQAFKFVDRRVAKLHADVNITVANITINIIVATFACYKKWVVKRFTKMKAGKLLNVHLSRNTLKDIF